MKKYLKKIISILLIVGIAFSMIITVKAANYLQTSVLMQYYSDNVWTSFSGFSEVPNITALRLTTIGGSFYLKYRTLNSGNENYYSYVDSSSKEEADYAGTGHLQATKRNIQYLDIDVYSTATDTKLSSGIVVMYRVKISSGWLSWVSNAPAEDMQLIKNTYSLDGELDTVSADAGEKGYDITGIDIRVFVLDESLEIPIELSGREQSPTLKYAANSNTLTQFDKKVQDDEMISAIKIATSSDKNYYLSYQASAEDVSGYYKPVKSTDDDYAGIFEKAIDIVKIQVFDLNKNNITKGVVVLYRVYTDKWLPWVSNANAEYMNSVKLRYNISGQLDTNSGYAGISGTRIKGIEIRIFEENELMTDCGFDNVNSLNVPYISQVGAYPTGCESVSTVMALNFAGNDITVDTFIDNYLDKSPYIHNFNPNECFGGDPRSASGMGCYAPAIEKALAKFLPNTNQYAVNLIGNSLENLCRDYIDNGIPVIVWATQGMKQAYNVSYEEGLEWIAPEHCLLLTGYDNRCYIFNDPLVGENIHYLKADVELAFEALGFQAIAIMKKEKPQVPNKPQIMSNIGSRVVLNEGYEYSLDGVTWQSENYFDNILNDEIYSFFIRIPSTDNSIESDASEPLLYIKSSPVKFALTGETKIVLDKEEGFEYSIDCINWQADNTFIGLEANTEYKIYKRAVMAGVSAYPDENAKTFITNGRDYIENPNGTDFFDLRKSLFDGWTINLAYDFAADNRIDMLDLITLKNILLEG